MTDIRGQFTFYASIFESAKRIRNKAARADFYDAICDYALNGIEPDLDKLSDAGAVGFISAKPNLDASRKKAKSGKAGGSAKQTASKPEANGKQTEAEPKQTVSEKENEKEKENEIEIEGENDKRSTPEAPPPDGSKPPAPPKPPSGFDGQSFSQFWNAYPDGHGKISRESAYAAWKALAPAKETAAKILSALDAWKKSGRWTDNGGAYIPSAANFLTKGYWKVIPPPPSSSGKDAPATAERKLDEDEQRAIRRMLAEPAEEVPE